jgi:hypothetical protein
VLFPRDVVEPRSPSAPIVVHAVRPGGRARTPTSVAIASTSSRARRVSRCLDHRTGETRLANSTDFVEYVRLADGLANIPYLATAFSTNDDIEARSPTRGAST